MKIHQQALLEELLHHEDVRERLSAVVERIRNSPRFTAQEKTTDNRVPGCSSSVWMICDYAHGKCRFRSDGDSHVVRGLVGLLTDFFSDLSPNEILSSKIDPLDLLDLNRGLTPTRRHGLAAVLTAIRRFAQAQPGAETPGPTAAP